MNRNQLTSYNTLCDLMLAVCDDNSTKPGVCLDDIHTNRRDDLRRDILYITGNGKTLAFYTTNETDKLYTPYLDRNITVETAYNLIKSVCY